MIFKNIKDLEKHLKSEIQDCLEVEVADEVKGAMAAWAEPNVYDMYQPKVYTEEAGLRTHTLSNRLFYDMEKTGDLQITISPGQPPNMWRWKEGEPKGNDLAELVHYGDDAGPHGYAYGWRHITDEYGRRYWIPRPWIPDAYKELKESGEATAALVFALRDKGIDAR